MCAGTGCKDKHPSAGPDDVLRGMESRIPGGESEIRDVGGGWWQKRDAASGRWFFVDAASGATQWETPAGVNAARLYKPPFERTAADAARDAKLKADIARFREAAAPRGDEPEESGLVAGAKGAIVYALLADLVLLVAALVWFLVGIFARDALGNPAVLDAFGATWQPLIQPSMGVLMLFTIAGGVLSGDDEDLGGRK